ncbi:hypothetical protein COEREDRAFT_87151 [Coemansia reversa NRRL 1564]|uniref:Zn(2)-C6 fungal-type domain-containing protein n=1 Tax=Coemansia reversa (strain ATCC 12441 / NRRL 1564) TaxID=763665 RepID=A0A2G5BB01_COERN|nr:hypothetical protein COEREDRAFT_87151 [Coemansia reversa NRRL 1564]|eukprot:PIA16180.1 hypothetical protein COEREDRAFT_87151 [Coemansia reversa NRRL 1564]
MDSREQSPIETPYSGSENQPPSDDEPDVMPQRSKRIQVKNACVNCQRACKKCDNNRPCNRCIKQGLSNSCEDSKRKPRQRGIKRGPYKKRKKKKDNEQIVSSIKTRNYIRKGRRADRKTDSTQSPLSRDSNTLAPGYGQFSPQFSPEQNADNPYCWSRTTDISQERRIFRMPPIGGFEEDYNDSSYNPLFGSHSPELSSIEPEHSQAQASPLNMLSDVALTEKPNSYKNLYSTPFCTPPLTNYRLGYFQSNLHIPLSNARFDAEYRSSVPIPSATVEKSTQPDYQNSLVDPTVTCREHGQMSSYSSDMMYEQPEKKHIRRLSQLLDKTHISGRPEDGNDNFAENVEAFQNDIAAVRQNTHITSNYGNNGIYGYGHHTETQLDHRNSLSGYEIS